MIKTKISIFLVIFSVVLLAVSCSEGNDILNSNARTYLYQCNVPNTSDSMSIVLDSVTGPVSNIMGVQDWLTLTATTANEEEHPTIRINVNGSGPGDSRQCNAIISLVNGDVVKLNLTQGLNYIPEDNGGNEDFLTDWEHQTSVKLCVDNNNTLEVNLPWAQTYEGSIPDAIRYEMKKIDGWQMAFSLLGTQSMSNANYFALYNKYLGILRVFYYCKDVTSSISDYDFEVQLGRNNGGNKYPFYNNLPYSLPTSYTNINTGLNILNAGENLTFKTICTAYNKYRSPSLSVGWTAFDVDFSGFVPDQVREKLMDSNLPINQSESFAIHLETKNANTLHLDGALNANIAGKFSGSITPGTTSSGGLAQTVSDKLGVAGKVLGDVTNSALASLEKALTGSTLDKICYYAGSAFNIASFASGLFAEEKVVSPDKLEGKIEMNLAGTVDLNGYSSGWTSNSASSPTINFSYFNKNSDVLSGVWSLAEAPVYYIISDNFLGNKSNLFLNVLGNHTYSFPNAVQSEIRMISFLDPTSIKLNLNPKIFNSDSIRKIEVECYCGVYPEMVKKHTSIYRKIYESLQIPDYVCIADPKLPKDSKISTLDGDGNMTYHKVSKETLINNYLDVSADSCKVVDQKGSNYRYYGRILTGLGSEERKFMIDPQIFFPVKQETNGEVLYDGEIPDIVVCVNVSFWMGNKKYMFSRRYLPEIKLLSGTSNIQNIKNNLQDYSVNSEAGKYINKTNNQIPVMHPQGYKLVSKALKMLTKILK